MRGTETTPGDETRKDRSGTGPTGEEMIRWMIEFLDLYGTSYLLGETFAGMLGSGNGRQKMASLVRHATGSEKNTAQFVSNVKRLLQPPAQGPEYALRVRGIRIPKMMMVYLLEKMFSGNRALAITQVEQLERVFCRSFSPEDHASLQEVIDTYPVRLSDHIIRQMRFCPEVARQYLPSADELDGFGPDETWVGPMTKGIVEQMYPNRVIFLLGMRCPVYCRFCFRKHKEARNMPDPTVADILRAVKLVEGRPTVKEVLLTGGDPLMAIENLQEAIWGLSRIQHVRTLRLGTRAIAYHPAWFAERESLLYGFQKQLKRRGKRLEVGTHFNHPDEISPASLEIINRLTGAGIAVYVQTPLLAGVNDGKRELARLFGLLRGAGAEIHYVFAPSHPIRGNRSFATPVSRVLEMAAFMRAHLTDRAFPRFCTPTPIGKIEWHSSGWAVAADGDDNRWIWLRTPYDRDYFASFAPTVTDNENVRVNGEGTLDIRCLAGIGSQRLISGARKKTKHSYGRERTACPSLLSDAQGCIREAVGDERSVVPTGHPRLVRLHKTRVSISLGAGFGVLDEIRRMTPVSDVVLVGQPDVVADLPAVREIVGGLGNIPHIRSVRLRSLFFNYHPERLTGRILAAIGRLNRLTVADPLRVEIETVFLHPDEIGREHRRICETLGSAGVSVHASTPLLGGVNDTPETMCALASGLRDAGIEFHHVLVAGTPLQERLNRNRPIDVANAIDIASQIRREGSGREIPCYILATPLGEVDFGLTSLLKPVGTGWHLKLAPYSRDYFLSMDSDFKWPECVIAVEGGIPWVEVRGLSDSGGFLFPDPSGWGHQDGTSASPSDPMPVPGRRALR